MDFPRLSTYLAGLAANNEKAWFEANRAEYQALRDDFTAFVAEMIARVAEFDETVRWVDPKDCIFRINRDVRFSKDKAPYKTTFSAVLGERGRRGGGPSYYLQFASTGTLMAGGGVWMPEPGTLGLIREHVAEHPEKLQAVLRRRAFKAAFGGLWEGDRLKRPPAGYPPDAPMIETIKLKSFIVERERDFTRADGGVGDWIAETFAAMHPFILWLREALAGGGRRAA